MKRLAIASAAMLAAMLHASAADVSVGYVQGPGGFYLSSDRSGPYAIGSDGVAHLLTSGSGGASSTFGAAFPATGTAAGAEYLASPPTLTPGQQVALQTDVNGNLKTTDSGAPITGQTIPAGGAGVIGWLTAIYSAATGAIPVQTLHGINIGGVEGVSNSGAAPTEYPIYNGLLAKTTAPTAVSDGQKVASLGDKDGRAIVLPYAPPELRWSCSVSATTTGAQTCTGSGNASFKTYITDAKCGRSDAGTTAITGTLNDASAAVIVMPNNGGGGGNNQNWTSPLVTSAVNTTLTVTFAGTVGSTAYCTLAGYFWH